MKKKRLILMTAISFLLLLAGPVFLVFCGFFLPEQYGDTFVGELKEKYALLKEAEGKKIVLIGGSGVAFGYDCSLIKEIFPEYEVVNFGMYGGLGTKIMLDLAAENIHKDDIVILSPEQEKQSLSSYFGGEYMWQAADGAFDLLREVKRENWGQLTGSFPDFAAEKLRYVIKGEKPEPEGVYSRDSFHAHGDIESEYCSYNIMPEGYDKNTPVKYEEDILEDSFADYMNDFAGEMEKKGALVWYRFCPVNEKAVASEENIEEYYLFLQRKLEFPIIGDPRKSIMEAEWFYDTNFHLNSSGKTVNTVQTIRDIKAMLGQAEAVAAPHVSPPEAKRKQAVEGNEEDTVYFTWKEEDGRAVLTGLTEEGKKREVLTIPVSFGKLPVKTLGTEVFAGNKRIRKIIIQKGMEFIEDGAFSGCSSLKAIQIENEDPSEVRPGQRLLEGTKALIYVDEKALSDYRTNYFWSLYAERIKY